MLPVLWVEFPTLPVVQTHLIISCVAASLAILVLCARVTARYMKGAKLWWDDYLALAAMVSLSVEIDSYTSTHLAARNF